MSRPARLVPGVTSSAEAPAPRVPEAEPAVAPARPGPRRRAAPRGRLRFVVLYSVVAGSMLLGLVSLNALLAQRAFRVDDLRGRVDALTQENLELVREQATLSAPGRIASWARWHGMRLPDDIRSLHVPAAGPADPAGDADPFVRQRTARGERGR